MDILRVNIILNHDSGMARDAAVNTWHFAVMGSDIAADADDCAGALSEFFREAVPATTRKVGAYLSNEYSTMDIKVYKLDEDGHSGAPIFAYAALSLPARLDTEDLPSEVAVCLSYRANSSPAVPVARRRGRVYIGALNAAARQSGSSPARPSSNLNTDLRLAAQRMCETLTATNSWVVYSRPYAGRSAIVRPGRTTLPALAARPGADYEVDEVWTDDAFDTQRRRGVRPTAKTFAIVNN